MSWFPPTLTACFTDGRLCEADKAAVLLSDVEHFTALRPAELKPQRRRDILDKLVTRDAQHRLFYDVADEMWKKHSALGFCSLCDTSAVRWRLPCFSPPSLCGLFGVLQVGGHL